MNECRFGVSPVNYPDPERSKFSVTNVKRTKNANTVLPVLNTRPRFFGGTQYNNFSVRVEADQGNIIENTHIKTQSFN